MHQAGIEINDKTDGVADDLLPNTRIEVVFYDSKCDATEGMTGALSLTRNTLAQGIDAIIGAGCSGAGPLIWEGTTPRTTSPSSNVMS